MVFIHIHCRNITEHYFHLKSTIIYTLRFKNPDIDKGIILASYLNKIVQKEGTKYFQQWFFCCEKTHIENYYPHCDILLVQINWNANGGLYYIPVNAQKRLFERIGRRNYINLPKPGTNPRGVEITKEALSALVGDSDSKCIIMNWWKTEISFNPYNRWVDLWREDLGGF